jgi:hypothetical protein
MYTSTPPPPAARLVTGAKDARHPSCDIGPGQCKAGDLAVWHRQYYVHMYTVANDFNCFHCIQLYAITWYSTDMIWFGDGKIAALTPPNNFF